MSLVSSLIGALLCALSSASTFDDKSKFYEDDYSLTKPFSQQDFWDMSGSTMISDKFIRLTSDVRSQEGTMWSKRPFRRDYWEINLSFRVHGKGKTLFGDGFALWYTQSRMEPGPVFGSKNGFKGMAVFFDTYSNHQGEHNHPHPYVSAMVSNGSLLYDHDSDGTHTQLSGCHFPFRNLEHATNVKITYLDDVLIVKTDLDNSGNWKPCFESHDVILPPGYFFGLSAVTGDLSDNHDIISFKVFSLKSGQKEKKNPLRMMPWAAKFDAPRARVESSEGVASKTLRSPMKTFLISVVVIIGVVFAMGVAYLYYKDREEKRLKRFY